MAPRRMEAPRPGPASVRGAVHVSLTFFASFKTEFVGEQVFDDLIHAHDQSFRYIEGFYNHRRLHSSIDFRTPDEAHFATL